MAAVEAETVDLRARRWHRTRSGILDLAWAIAERDGLAALSLRELGREAGMRAPSLYTYFDSKAAIFDAMFAQGYEQMDERFAELVIDPRDPPVASLTTVLVAFLEFCQASIPRYQLMFTAAVANWEPAPHAYAASVASYERMAAVFATLGLHGQAALDLWSAVSAGLAAQQLANDPNGDRWVRLSRDAAEMVLRQAGRMQ